MRWIRPIPGRGSFAYQVPIAGVDGLSASASYTRSVVNLDNGAFATLDIHGPTQQTALGLDWKFVNSDAWRVQSWLHLVKESSRLQGLGVLLSKQKFDVAELGTSVRHDDRQRHAIDLLQLSVRGALDDDSPQTDYLYARHDRHFTVARLSYTRLQGLTATQRLQLRFNGQYSDDTLTPLEQFSLGGPTSVRAFPLGAALGDRGFDSGLEYQVDAPGFATAASPFGGRAWGQLLTASVFYDYGRVYPNGANRRRVRQRYHLRRRWCGPRLPAARLARALVRSGRSQAHRHHPAGRRQGRALLGPLRPDLLTWGSP